MNDLIIAKLKTGPIKAVIKFGETMPSALTYAVVIEEPTQFGYTRYRVNAHMQPGQQDALRLYCKKTVFDLLAYIEMTGSEDRRFELKPLGISKVVTTNTDKTISQEAIFSLPEMSYV
jgi:hypothetical protein